MLHKICNVYLNMNNPFSVTGYYGPEYFCDREDDLSRLVNSVENSRTVVLSSMRRIGKTGLIQHLHHHLKKSNKWDCIYIDILDTKNDNDLINKLISVGLNILEKQNSKLFQNLIQYFSSFRPVISIDPLTGSPNVSLDIKSKQDVQLSLEKLFELISKNKKKIQISIDEFQQIKNYQEGSVIDATLRSIIQKYNSLHFIFSGSQRNLLESIFITPTSPMFSMSEMFILEKIPYSSYFDFIKNNFHKANKKISDVAVHDILTWTNIHTFYVQFLCNRIFSTFDSKIHIEEINKTKLNILKEFENTYINYKNILSPNQFKVLLGIAKEGGSISVMSKDFTTKYNIAASSAKQSLEYLLTTEMVYKKSTKENSYYFVYDLFFSRWLERY